MTQKGYIYAITNKVNSDVYIGSTTRSVEERFNEHKLCSRRSRKTVFHHFMADIGVENFDVVELKCINIHSLLELLSIEESYIRDFGTLNTSHGSNDSIVSREDFKRTGRKLIKKELTPLPSKEEIFNSVTELKNIVPLNDFIDMFMPEERNFRKMFSDGGMVYVSPTLFNLFGYEGDFKAQRAAFLKFAKRQNIKPLELTSTSTEIEEFPEIKNEINNDPKNTACRKWIVMTSRDIKTVMMKLGTKNGDMIRSYYVDLEELIALYAEYTMFFNLREAKAHKDQAVAELNKKMDDMRLSMEAKHEQTVQKHEQALEMLSKMGITLDDVKEQKLLHINEETNDKLDDTVE